MKILNRKLNIHAIISLWNLCIIPLACYFGRQDFEYFAYFFFFIVTPINGFLLCIAEKKKKGDYIKQPSPIWIGVINYLKKSKLRYIKDLLNLLMLLILFVLAITIILIFTPLIIMALSFMQSLPSYWFLKTRAVIHWKDARNSLSIHALENMSAHLRRGKYTIAHIGISRENLKALLNDIYSQTTSNQVLADKVSHWLETHRSIIP